ncbi:MBL fold metallo-hydrolase [Streptomyces sp. MMS24-I2-30]|uniref:MBL fold metallo-hydrolase n=1 Tax=Streptomyces sp. MMS24-I2-30 TaxID=3351564 RepID=UPI003896B755
MTLSWTQEPYAPQPLADRLARPAAGAEIFWLGQAGFVLRGETGGTVLIDAYLSDHLRAKYAGKLFEHVRMQDAPITPDALPPLDVVLCSHHHSDHMDPDALPLICAANPGTPVVVPAASVDRPARIGLPLSALLPADAGDALDVAPGVRVHVVPSAHEDLEYDEQGRCRFLGYVIELGGVRIYHSGDCAPYPGQAEHLAALAPDIALLPVNGRDTHRRTNGVPGNFHPDEAVALCRDAGIPVLLGHHYGMFAFNTIDAAVYQHAVSTAPGGLSVSLAQQGTVLRGERR